MQQGQSKPKSFSLYLGTLDEQIKDNVQQNYKIVNIWVYCSIITSNIVIAVATCFSPSSVPLSGDAILARQTDAELRTGITTKVNLQNTNGERPLHLAAAAGNVQAIEALIFMALAQT